MIVLMRAEQSRGRATECRDSAAYVAEPERHQDRQRQLTSHSANDRVLGGAASSLEKILRELVARVQPASTSRLAMANTGSDARIRLRIRFPHATRR